MKKKALAIVAAVAAFALCATMLAGCSGNSNSNKLIVGFDAEYPPYGYMGDDGNYTGFDLELAQEVAKRNGWEIELQAIDWDAKDSLISAGTITCIWNGFTMEGRENDYAFSEPYMNNSQVILVKADSPIATEADLAGKTVLTQADSAAQELLETPAAEDGKADLTATFKDGKVITIGDYNNALLQLEAGAVDALACDYSIAAYAMAQKPGAYKIAVTLSTEHYAVGFKKGNTEQADKVTATLKEMVADGFVDELIAKYADQGISKDAWCLEA